MRLIDGDALADSLRESKNKLKEILDDERCEMEYRICEGQMNTFIEAILRVNETPTIDAEPVIHGWWIPFSDHMWACSNCRVMGSPQWKRCPVCEAKMDGGAEDD